jgi:hypothetical protein
MKDFLNEYVKSLSTQRLENIHNILRSAQVGKSDIGEIIKRLNEIQALSPISVDSVKVGSRVSNLKLDRLHRQLSLRFGELFDTSNMISLVLNSETNILTSEIKALEDELIVLEKEIDNYAFSLADNGFYDYVFMESFNNETMRETASDQTAMRTDRGGQARFKSIEDAYVDTKNGSLRLHADLRVEYPLRGSVLNSNCITPSTNVPPLSGALNGDNYSGWKVTVRSDTKINSSIYTSIHSEALEKGAQIWLEITLPAASPCDSIVLVPFSDIPIDILRVELYSGWDCTQNHQGQKSKTVVKRPLVLDRPRTISFPNSSVSFVRILLNQSIYKRKHLMPEVSEIRYKASYDEIKHNRSKANHISGKSFVNNEKALKRVFVGSQDNTNIVRLFRIQKPEVDFNIAFGPLTAARVIHADSLSKKEDVWNYKSQVNSLMKRMINERMLASNSAMLNGNSTYVIGQTLTGSGQALNSLLSSGLSISNANSDHAIQPEIGPEDIGEEMLTSTESLAYYYEIGLRNVQIGLMGKNTRGVFISKMLPATSDSGVVKIKVDHTNYELIETDRDSVHVTSVEYSVSNKSKPNGESDWVPIIPVDDNDIQSERVFIGASGRASLRFPASLSDSIVLYKNGYVVDSNNIEFIKTEDNTAVIAIKIPVATFTPNDIFTIDYVAFGEHKFIDFNQVGSSQTSLSTAYDDNGSGQTFSSTNGERVIALANEPFVNYDQVEQNGGYSSQLGFTGTYQPVTIILSDGTIALNQTNYNGGSQNNLSSFATEDTVFLHSGKNIIFNKAIDQEFTVYYQYLPSNLRFRTILRVNIDDFISPTVDFVQVKTKTRKPDPRRTI